MTGVKNCWILVVLSVPWTFVRGAAVLCPFLESCILPCTFEQGEHILIHWIKEPENIGVHSFYREQDQFERQNPQFKGRTKLFKDQVPKGNASLMLTAVTFQDQGRYKCYTSTITSNKEAVIYLNIEAPPREVRLIQEGNVISCSSEGIFPKPSLNWTSSPPVPLTQDPPTVSHTQQGLYSINSSLVVSNWDLDYSCTVSADRNSKQATLFKPASVSTSDTETELPCMSSNTPIKSLVWRFNHSQNILTWTQSDATFKASEEWREYVKSVSESGSLTLRHLTPDRGGTFTCELSTAEKKHMRSTELTVTESQHSPKAAGIAVGVIAAVLVVASVTLGFIYRKRIWELLKKGKPSDDHGGECQNRLNGAETEPLKTIPPQETTPQTEHENGTMDHT